MEHLAEIVGVRLSRFSRIPGNQNAIDGVCPIEGSLIFGQVKMVLSTDLMCCKVIFVRSFSLATARNIRLASAVRNSRKRSSPTRSRR